MLLALAFTAQTATVSATHPLAARADGAGYAWGGNFSGRVGNGAYPSGPTRPTATTPAW